MMCPVCKRDLAPTLSICVTCGAMMNDSVREELHSKVNPMQEPTRFEPEPARFEIDSTPVLQKDPSTPEVVMVKQRADRIETSDLAIKKTSQTLAEFRTPNATLPDWRLQLQNSIRQRTGRGRPDESTVEAVATKVKMHTNGANALKAEYIEEHAPPEPMNSTVATALKRIEDSRRAFLKHDKEVPAAKPATGKSFPFNVVSRSDELAPRQTISRNDVSKTIARPKLVSSLRIEKKDLDTNKLVPIPEAARLASSFENTDEVVDKPKKPIKDDWSKKIEIREKGYETAVTEPETPIVEEVETDEIDDLAPITMRFNAGLFDLIIGGFASMILLSPFLFATDGWISLSGIFAILTVMSIIMFVYLTASISYLGRTFGMKMFSLELVDVEQSEYPTLHQAAVNSSVYLLSLAFGGIGFIPMFFNEEKRAAHDLVSGTILLREL